MAPECRHLLVRQAQGRNVLRGTALIRANVAVKHLFSPPPDSTVVGQHGGRGRQAAGGQDEGAVGLKRDAAAPPLDLKSPKQLLDFSVPKRKWCRWHRPRPRPHRRWRPACNRGCVNSPSPLPSYASCLQTNRAKDGWIFNGICRAGPRKPARPSERNLATERWDVGPSNICFALI